MVPWADVSDGGNQLRCTSYCTLGKLHFRQIAQIAAHKLAADKSVDSLQIQYTINQDQRSAMQIINQEHMWHPKCMTKCICTIIIWIFEYWLRIMCVSRLCAQICRPSDQTAAVREPLNLLGSNSKVLLSYVRRESSRWNFKFFWKIKIHSYTFMEMFHQCQKGKPIFSTKGALVVVITV